MEVKLRRTILNKKARLAYADRVVYEKFRRKAKKQYKEIMKQYISERKLGKQTIAEYAKANNK